MPLRVPEQLLHGPHDDALQGARARLKAGIEARDLLDPVVLEDHAQGLVVPGHEEVEDLAAQGELAGEGHARDAKVAVGGKAIADRRRIDRAAHLEEDARGAKRRRGEAGA